MPNLGNALNESQGNEQELAQGHDESTRVTDWTSHWKQSQVSHVDLIRQAGS